MAIPGVGRCFHCNDPTHWAEACWTQKPPTSRDHHESRLVLYRNWSTEGLPERMPRITPQQRAALIKNETRMWNDVKANTERKAS